MQLPLTIYDVTARFKFNFLMAGQLKKEDIVSDDIKKELDEIISRLKEIERLKKVIFNCGCDK